MKTDCALYVEVLPDGKIERELATINGKVCMESTTIEQEIITFSELEFGPYAAIVDLLAYSASNLSVEGRMEEVDVEEFQFLLDTANGLVTSLEAEHPLHGTLTRTALEDQVPDDDGTGLYIYRAADRILSVCSEAMILQMRMNEILSDMRKGLALDIKKKHKYLQMLAFTQVFEFGEGWSSRYRFRSLTDYYYFLLVHFIKQSPTVSLCECCGRYFIPKTKKPPAHFHAGGFLPTGQIHMAIYDLFPIDACPPTPTSQKTMLFWFHIWERFLHRLAKIKMPRNSNLR